MMDVIATVTVLSQFLLSENVDVALIKDFAIKDLDISQPVSIARDIQENVEMWASD